MTGMRNMILLLFISNYAFSQDNLAVQSFSYPDEFEQPYAILELPLGNDFSLGIKHIVFDKNALHYVNASYGVKKSLAVHENHVITASRRGMYLLIKENHNVPETKTDPNGKVRFSYINNLAQTKQYLYSRPYYYDDLSVHLFLLSDASGNMFEYSEESSTLIGYSSSGSEISRYVLFNDQKFRPAEMDISGDGKLLGIAASRIAANPGGVTVSTPLRGRYAGQQLSSYKDKVKGEPHIFLFNADGQFIRDIRLSGDDVRSLVIDENGEYVTISVGEYTNIPPNGESWITYIYSNLGELLFTLPNYLNFTVFSNNEISGFYFNENNQQEVVSYDLRTGQRLFSKVIEDRLLGLTYGSGITNKPNLSILSISSDQSMAALRINQVDNRNGRDLHSTVINNISVPYRLKMGEHGYRVYQNLALLDKLSRVVTTIQK